MWSTDLLPDQILPMRYFGRDLIAWRDGIGVAHVSTAYCPHLGANLGIGGSCSSEGIRCPFHGWLFGPDGRVRDIPYSTQIPLRPVLAQMPVCEMNGHIMVWYSQDGAQPIWFPPYVPEFQSADHGYYYCTDRISIRSSCQELSENFIDLQHVPVLHDLAEINDLRVVDEGPLRLIQLSESIPTPFGNTALLQSSMECYGLGYVVVRFESAITVCSVSSVIPIDEDSVEVRFSWLAIRKNGRVVNRRIADLIALRMVQVFREDISIWESKMYRERPVLVPEDGDIVRFRRWCAQMYES